MSDEYVTPTTDDVRRRLQRMDPHQFEHFVADVWGRLGWDTEVVGEPGDRGIDVRATKAEEKQLIQAKRYGPNTTVGSPEVQQYASLRLQEDDVNQVTIVTTGTFSTQATDMAPELDVILVDGESLIEIVGEIDAWDIVAAYFDDVDLAIADKGTSEQGVFDRMRTWFG